MTRRLLSACYRSPYLAVAALQGQKVLEVRRHRLWKQGAKAAAREHIAALAASYGARAVIVELGSLPHRALEGRRGLAVRVRRLSAAKEDILSADKTKTIAGLVAKLLSERPDLRRLIEKRRTGRSTATGDQRATAGLLALALGLHEAGWHKP